MRLSFWLLLLSLFSSSHAQIIQGFNLDGKTENVSSNIITFPDISTGRKSFIDAIHKASQNLDPDKLYETTDGVGNGITKAGEDLQITFCSMLEGMLTKNPNSTTATIPSSMSEISSYMNSNFGSGIEFSPVLPQMIKTAQRVESEYRIGHCSDNPKGCFSSAPFGGKPYDSDYFRDTCADAFAIQFEPKGLSLDANFTASSVERLTRAFKALRESTPLLEKGGCRDKKHCYFFSEKDSAKTCDLFNCSLSSDLDKQPAMKIGQVLAFGSDTLDFASSDTDLCNECFQKAHDMQSNGNFERKKDTAKKLIQDQLAAKNAAKSLDKLKQHAEAMFDLSSLSPSSTSENFCQAQLNNTLSDKTCSGKISKDQFQTRLSQSLAEAGMESSTEPAMISELILKSVNPTNRSKNTCTRKDFARQKKVDFDLPSNLKYKVALKKLLDGMALQPEMASLFTEENCENPKNKNFVDAYSEEITKSAWAELAPLLKEEIRVGSSASILEGVCSKATGFFSEQICGKGGELFQLMADQNTFASFSYQQKYPELYNDPSEENFARFEDFMKGMIKNHIASALHVPMEMNPYLKLGLNDWKFMCEKQKELAQGKDPNASIFNSIMDLENTIAASPILENYNDRVCGELAAEFSKTICSEPELLPSGPKVVDLEGLKKIKSDLFKNKDVDGYALNSVACEVKAHAKNIGNDPHNTPIIEEPFNVKDILAGGLNFENYSGCNEDTRKYQAAMLGLPMIDDKGQKNFVYVPSKESYKAQKRSIFQTAAASFKQSTDAKLKNDLPDSFKPTDTKGKSVKRVSIKKPSVNESKTIIRAAVNFDRSPIDRSVASLPSSPAIEDCGVNCVGQSVVSNRIVMSDFDKKFAMSPRSKVDVKAPSNDEKTKKLFEEILSGKIGQSEIEAMKKENKVLKEEIGKVKDKLADQKIPTKVLDSHGNDRSSYIREPASSTAVVFNPRNPNVNEFRSRKFFESQREQFTPNYQPSVYEERVSFSEYSKQRRESASVVLDEVKKFNFEIDKTFLKSVKSEQVDDNFVKEYVEHVNKNSGSIEHLIVYEAGEPKAIRVPDPLRPGEYVEYPIAYEMASIITKHVEEDEKESYAIFNMVNFGESLQDYMAHIESRESEITTLAAMNHRLKEMKSLEN